MLPLGVYAIHHSIFFRCEICSNNTIPQKVFADTPVKMDMSSKSHAFFVVGMSFLLLW